MMTQGTKTANYKITTDASGKVVSFYCALSGMHVCRCTVRSPCRRSGSPYRVGNGRPQSF